MTTSTLRGWRRAWIRYGIAVACLLFSVLGRRSGCDDDFQFFWGFILAAGLLILSAAVSFVRSVLAARFGWRDALAEFGVGILMLSAIALMVVAQRLSAPDGCE